MQNISFSKICNSKEEVREIVEHLLSQIDYFYNHIWGELTISYQDCGLSLRESLPKNDTMKKNKS